MSTRALAKKLGLLEIVHTDGDMKENRSKQPFDYMLVLDFEATCWKNNESKHSAEIIEFPVVLYDVRNDKILDEFQQYVMPTEHPKLSDFCTELTGITQNQVDSGVPLPTCLMLFMRWLNEKRRLYNMDFPNSDDVALKSCCFTTWSNWDLGTCFKNECNRKKLSYPKIFRKWIDVRQLFKFYFKRPFSGLSGALSELGLTFEGIEHCGLHDARNTARLIAEMVKNGAVFELTRK